MTPGGFLQRTVVTSAIWVAAVLLSIVAGLAWPAFPAAEQEVKIAWKAGLSETNKAAAAADHRLTLLEVRDDGVWVTTAGDSSSNTIRGLVQDPRVRDTDGVDRAAFSVQRGPSETVLAWLARQVPDRADYIQRSERNLLSASRIPFLFLAWGLVTFLVVAFRAGVPGWIGQGIPRVSPSALALFRAAYGTAMVLAFSTMSFQPLRVEDQRQQDWLARLELVQQLGATAGVFDGANLVARMAMVCFAIGLAPRFALAVGAGAFLVLDALMVTQESIHDWGLPMVTMFLLLLAPWQVTPGTSTILRRWRGVPDAVSATPHGLALWIPGLTIGLAFLAAAHTKLDVSGIAWITTGAVRFHFIDDAGSAVVPWGLRLAASDAAAVALSVGAILLEGSFWLVTFVRHSAVRLLFGLAAALLLGGFYLFQGVFWPAWWTLLLAFLPWAAIADWVTARLPRLTVMADGECPLCRRTVRVLHAIDLFDRLDFADAADDLTRERVAPGLGRDAALAEMYVIAADGRRRAGYDGYLRLATALPLLWPALAVGVLPPVKMLGRAVYRRVAASRRRVGRCTDDVCDATAPPLPRGRVIVAPSFVAIPRGVAVALALLALQQVVVSAIGLESEPFVSNFPMYSWTWTSREDFAAHMREQHRRYEASATGLDPIVLTERLDSIGLDGALRGRVFDAVAAGRELDDDDSQRLQAAVAEYTARFGAALPPLRVIRYEAEFDWTRGLIDDRAHVGFDSKVDLARLPASGGEH